MIEAIITVAVLSAIVVFFLKMWREDGKQAEEIRHTLRDAEYRADVYVSTKEGWKRVVPLTPPAPSPEPQPEEERQPDAYIPRSSYDRVNEVKNEKIKKGFSKGKPRGLSGLAVGLWTAKETRRDDDRYVGVYFDHPPPEPQEGEREVPKCPECGSRADRPRCLHGLPADECPRHEVMTEYLRAPSPEPSGERRVEYALEVRDLIASEVRVGYHPERAYEITDAIITSLARNGYTLVHTEPSGEGA